MHGHIFVLWDSPAENAGPGDMRIYAMCETDRDVYDAIDQSAVPTTRFFLERWCIESTLEETGEW